MQNAFERYRDEQAKNARMKQQRKTGLRNLLRGAAHKMGGEKSAAKSGIGGLASLLSFSMKAEKSRDAAAIALGLPSDSHGPGKGSGAAGQGTASSGAGNRDGSASRRMRASRPGASDSDTGTTSDGSDSESDSDPDGFIGSTLDRPTSRGRGDRRGQRSRKGKNGADSARGRRRSEAEQDELAGIVRALVSTARANRQLQQKRSGVSGNEA